MARRRRVIRETRAVIERLQHLPSYCAQSVCGQTLELMSKLAKGSVTNIPAELDGAFYHTIISTTQAKHFAKYYELYYQEASSVSSELTAFFVSVPATVVTLISDYENISNLVKRHNAAVIAYLLETYKDFFDHCLSYPLDSQQRRAIISDEDNCLVVSSAGSGKTSSIVGKVKYLTEVKGVAPERILLISYTNKAANELTDRMATDGLQGYTFHKLAMDIIAMATGEKPSICGNTDALFVDIYHELCERPDFKQSVLEYFVDYQIGESEMQRYASEKREQLSERKDKSIKALLPDMDGHSIYVKSEQEQKICFALSSLGISFRYEEAYEYQLADGNHSQYHPDFSIYYNHGGVRKRIYLEHFGVDEHGYVPAWFAKDNNISYIEANLKYNDGITWKKAAHKKFGTKLLVTDSADFQYTDIREKLRRMMVDAGVPIQERSDEELYNVVLPKGSRQEKAFIRLVVTFVTLLKTSCKSIDNVLEQVKSAHDKRSAFIIGYIFRPVYERYLKALKDNGQIDFTDTIVQATEICRVMHPVTYDYIVVDEFQDISLDRYYFLKALREGTPPAKLYCVGDDWQSIYRFSGSDMALFNQFADYFGATEINKIETTYRFGEPLVRLSSQFIQRNTLQMTKNLRSYDPELQTKMEFLAYERRNLCTIIGQLVSAIPLNKSIFLLGRYSFDDYYLSFVYQSVREGNKFYYIIGDRKIEFLTVHKSKGLEADYVIILQCNKGSYGFPSFISDDPVLDYVLTKSDQFPFGEERRVFYVAITRAKIKTIVLYDRSFPSVFVDEFLRPETVTSDSYVKHPNANKVWTKAQDDLLIRMYREGKNVEYIADRMGRSKTSIIMRLKKLN